MRTHRSAGMLFYALAGLLPCIAHGAGVVTLDPVEVKADADDLIGTADSASVGTITPEQLRARPVFRPGELLEEVPGLIVTQHSGEGKANQYFLRGFNIDHGTDLRTDFAGMPVNARSHGHGQGYTDLNFVIPELVTRLQYKKGTYFADEGDFSAAGAVQLDYADRLDEGLAVLGLGEDGYRRLLAADSSALAGGDLLYGVELYRYDGPWEREENFDKINAVLRYGRGSVDDGWRLTALAYDSDGNATNQIARRAVEQGFIDRLDTLDASDGSDSSRYSLSADWAARTENSDTAFSVYAVRSLLSLYSNFTYFLDFPDPAVGDQFEQRDERTTTGFDLRHTRYADWGGRETDTTFGIQLQHDAIDNGLFRTVARERFSTVREDGIGEASVGLYAENRLQWMPWFRTLTGLRADWYRASVDADLNANSGTERDHIVNPKLSLIFGPWSKTEYFINAGGGFHSNDARGATIAIDPGLGLGGNVPAERVPLLVRAKGYELGLRSALVPGLQSGLVFYLLDFDSELVFVGDAGNTEASRPSRRVGFEWANYYRPLEWLTVDADFAYTQARFRDSDTAGDHIPGAVEGVATVGFSIDRGNWLGGLQARWFGPRPLIEDNSVRSSSTFLLSGRIGYRFTTDLRLVLEGFNLLDRDDEQISYFYESRLRQELNDPATAEGISDVHFHPVEPRSFRLSLQIDF